MTFMGKYFQKTSAHILLAFVAALAVLFFQAKDRWQEAPYADEVTYMAIALPLFDTGIYQDGNFRKVSGKEGKNGEGMFFAPLYPTFLTGLMKLSPPFADTVRCSVKNIRPKDIAEKCAPLNLQIMIVVQIILMSLGAACAFKAAHILTESKIASWIAFIFLFTGKDYAELATVAMNESLLLPLFSFSMMAFLLAWKKPSIVWTVLCGAGFGLLCLTKPSFVYMLFCAVPFFAIVSFWKYGAKKQIALIVLFTLICASVIAPWVYRNGTKMGVWDISYGMAPFTFAQRAAFNDMRWSEWAVSFVYGLPSFGDNLSEDIFPKEYYARHDFSNMDGFYQYGNRVLRPETLKEAGSYDAQFPYLLDHFLFKQPFKHVMVTFSLVWRGMWTGGKLALIALPALALLSIVAIRRKRWDFVFYAGIPLFMLGFHAFTSVNVARYNLILLPSMGIAFAWALLWAWQRWKPKGKTV